VHPREAEVGRGPGAALVGSLQHDDGRPDRRFGATAQRQDVRERLGDAAAEVRVRGRQLRGPPQDGFGAGQRATCEVAPPRLEQEPRRPVGVPGTQREVGGEVAPRAVQPGVGGADRIERPSCPLRTLGRQHPGEHGVPAEGVVEAELVIPVGLHQPGACS
jgi:hypothetical protein